MNADAHDELTEQQLAALDAALARADVWDGPPPGLEDAIVAAISAEAAIAPANVMAIDRGRRARVPLWLAAAAAAVLVVGGFVIARMGSNGSGVDVTLAATDAAPGASAVVNLAATPAGLKILLDVDGLPGAPEGSFYEAWISDGETKVSAGTFHLRDGDGEIELWAGVADPRFDRMTITIEPLDGVAESSGNVLLAGEFDLDG